MLNLINPSEKKIVFTSSSMNIHAVDGIHITHEEDYTEIVITGEHGITLRLFHKGEGAIPVSLLVPPPEPAPPIEAFPEYPTA